MMGRECSCRGFYERCMHCYGRGYLPIEKEPEIPLPMPVRRPSSLPPKTSTVEVPLRSTYLESKTVQRSPKNIIKRQACPTQSASPSHRNAHNEQSTRIQYQIRCMLCEQLLSTRKRVVRNHFQQAHCQSTRPNNSEIMSSVKMSASHGEQVVQCVCCPAHVLASRLAKHLLKVHCRKQIHLPKHQEKPQAAAMQVFKPFRKQIHPTKHQEKPPRLSHHAGSHSHSIQHDNYYYERQLDGSRGMYFAGIRGPDGRYDSTPSFDSFDAESRP